MSDGIYMGPEVSKAEREGRMQTFIEHSAAMGYGDARAVPVRDIGDDMLDGAGRSSHCCCRKFMADGIGGACVAYECCETTCGECSYRVGSEPSLDCLYKLLSKMTVEGVENSFNACIRIEAHEEADRLYEEEHYMERMPVAGPV